MLRIIKNIIKKLLCIYYSFKQKVKIGNGFIVSYEIINNTYRSSFLDAVTCYGNVNVGRYRSIVVHLSE